MKTLTLIVLSTCLVLPSLYAAEVFFGFGDGYYHRHHHYRYETWNRPVVVVEDEPPVVVHEHVVTTAPSDSSVPYGYMQGGNLKSPWSDFSMPVGGKTSGQTVYDPNNGKAFRVP